MAKPSSTVADKLNMLETLLREMSEESRKIVITSKVLSHLIYELPLYLNCRDTDKAIHTGQWSVLEDDEVEHLHGED